MDIGINDTVGFVGARIRLHDVIELTLDQFEVTVAIEGGRKQQTFDLKEFLGRREKFYPCISMHGDGLENRIMDFQVLPRE